MLSTIALVVAGLSTGHKIGLATVGGLFILFALTSAFLLPRNSPNFPGKGMGIYAGICVLFFVAMISAVLVFGKESKEASAAGQTTSTPTATTPTTTTPTATAPTTAPTTTAPTTTAPATSGTAGNAAAGKAVFVNAGCSGCHTLKAANATGTVGPNLDTLKPALATVVHQVEVGGGPMPSFKGQLSTQQIQDVAAFVYASTHP